MRQSFRATSPTRPVYINTPQSDAGVLRIVLPERGSAVAEFRVSNATA